MFIYNTENISTFLNINRNSNDNSINLLLQEIKNTLFENNQILNIDNQIINTENDLKCILFHKIKQIDFNLQYEIHSEESDLIVINDTYCTNLTLIGDITRQNTRTRTTDLTITINPIENEEINIQKGYSRFGQQIDIELKYIRKGFTNQYLKDIRRDLCKLKYVVDSNVEHHNNTNASSFGIFFLGFRKKSILIEYLNNGLLEKLNYFNTLDNIGLLMFYRENDI